MKYKILELLKKARDNIDNIIERDIDSENDVREDLADPQDLEKYIKDLEKLSRSFEELAKQISEIVGEDKEDGIFNSSDR